MEDTGFLHGRFRPESNAARVGYHTELKSHKLQQLHHAATLIPWLKKFD